MRKYIQCPKCQGVGVIPIRPRSEWTNDIEKNFVICPMCQGLGRIREGEGAGKGKADAASE